MKISNLLAIVFLVGCITACATRGATSSGNNEKELVENGYIALSAGDYRTAENLLERALAINTRNPFTWLNLGVVFQDTHRYFEARKAYQTVIDLNPSPTTEAGMMKGYAGKSLTEIARINMASLPPVATWGANGGTDGDTDADGVPDAEDRCGNTPAGAVVGVDGCWTLMDIFESGKASILPGAEDRLAAVIAILRRVPAMRLEIQGYTDDRGPRSMNQRLSEDRARSVGEYLIRNGVASDRLKWMGYGQNRPVASNGTAEGRRQNRRVELVPLP